MASLTDNLLLDPLLRQPFLSSEREDSHGKLVAAVAISPSEFDISPLGLIVACTPNSLITIALDVMSARL